MSVLRIILSIAALASAVLAIWSDAAGRKRLYRVAKPLATVLIISVAAIAAAPMPASYKTLVLAGLLFSLLGDVALIVPEKWFTAGLVAFLTAHILYILAFKPGPGHQISAAVFLPFVLYGLLMFFLLAPGLGTMKVPVLVYIAAITVMVGFAAGRFIDFGGTRPLRAFAGAILFLISDSALAYNRFAKKIPRAQLFVLGTYYPAQLLIALSV